MPWSDNAFKQLEPRKTDHKSAQGIRILWHATVLSFFLWIVVVKKHFRHLDELRFEPG